MVTPISQSNLAIKSIFPLDIWHVQKIIKASASTSIMLSSSELSISITLFPFPFLRFPNHLMKQRLGIKFYIVIMLLFKDEKQHYAFIRINSNLKQNESVERSVTSWAWRSPLSFPACWSNKEENATYWYKKFKWDVVT